MALGSYDDLKASLSSWLFNRADLTDQIPDFIRLCEIFMDDVVEHRNRAATITLTLDGELTDLPADFRGAITLADTDKVLPLVTLEQIAQDKLCISDASQQRYAILGDQIQIWPAPANGDELELVYLQAIPALSDSNTTNWLLDRYPNAYLYGSLLQAAPYLAEDDRIAVWQSLFQAAIASMNRTRAREQLRGVSIRSASTVI